MLRNDLSDLPAALGRLLAYHRGARDKRKPLGEEGVEALVDLLAPSVEIRLPLGEQLMDEAAHLESLTQEQSRALRQMRRNSRMVFIGCAGSGKTMLAVNHAHRLSNVRSRAARKRSTTAGRSAPTALRRGRPRMRSPHWSIATRSNARTPVS
jgi:hypothetical protein